MGNWAAGVKPARGGSSRLYIPGIEGSCKVLPWYTPPKKHGP